MTPRSGSQPRPGFAGYSEAAVRVGIVALGPFPPNVLAFLENLARLLGDDADLDLVVDRPVPTSLADAFESHVYRLSAARRGWRQLESIRAVWDYARTVRPSLLTHVVDFQTLGLVVSVVGRALRIPTVTRYPGEVLSSRPPPLPLARRIRALLIMRGLSQIPLRLSHRVVATGPRLAAELRRWRVPADRVIVLPQPVDRGMFRPAPDRLSVRASLGLPTAGRIVLFVGRLTWLKGADVFLRCVPPILDRTDDLSFCFVGSGPYERALQGLGRRVYVRGPVPHDEVASYYQAADLLALPSRTEGLPTVLLEALACGVPVVSRDVGDASFVTANLVRTEDEFLRFLLRPHWPQEELPESLDDRVLRDRYLAVYVNARREGAP